jgi:hypothetical protein
MLITYSGTFSRRPWRVRGPRICITSEQRRTNSAELQAHGGCTPQRSSLRKVALAWLNVPRVARPASCLMRVARRIDVGVVLINNYCLGESSVCHSAEPSTVATVANGEPLATSFKRYREVAGVAVARSGGRFLVRGAQPVAAEGEWPSGQRLCVDRYGRDLRRSGTRKRPPRPNPRTS